MEIEMTQHGFIQEEKGPEDMRGVALRVVEKREGALDGYAKWLVDFWPSQKAFDDDQPGFDGHTKSEIQKRIVLHPNAFYAIKAADHEGRAVKPVTTDNSAVIERLERERDELQAHNKRLREAAIHYMNAANKDGRRRIETRDRLESVVYIKRLGRFSMTNYTKHTGTEIPSELAGAQIIEWNINMDPMNGVNEKDRVDAITWLSNPAMGHIYYRPTLDPDGIPYCSAEGLMIWANYVATSGDGNPRQYHYRPEWSERYNAWRPEPVHSPNRPRHPTLSGCPTEFIKPGPPAESLMRVWR